MMRWLPHILLGYAAIGLQRGLDALLSFGAAQIDLVLIAGGFFAAVLSRTTAPLAGLVLGLAYDLTGTGPVGLRAVSLGLAMLLAASLPANRWSRLMVVIGTTVALAACFGWLLGLLRMAGDDARVPGFGGTVGTIALTIAAAVPLSAPLWRWRRVFTVDGQRF